VEKKTNQPKWVSKIIAKSWLDDDFKNRLVADPVGTLKSEGVDFPAGVEVKVLENSDKLMHFIIPPKPIGELSDEKLISGTGMEAGNDPVYPDCYDQCMYCGSPN
jgi:Nitrile hydratase, alpha chain